MERSVHPYFYSDMGELSDERELTSERGRMMGNYRGNGVDREEMLWDLMAFLAPIIIITFYPLIVIGRHNVNAEHSEANKRYEADGVWRLI